MVAVTPEFDRKMENMLSLRYKEDESDQMDLPPGFRFHPTDEELISHYLHPKVINTHFTCRAIGFVDLNKSEPWDLPWKANLGEKEWYFFCIRDRKYPTGLRTNRATEAGYWKATGKDKEIYKGKSLVGMKKTLVFYKGRAPKGEKTNWVMHEFRLDGKLSVHLLPKAAKNEWVISRVFQKSNGGKQTHISGMMRLGSNENELGRPSGLPPLMEPPSPIGNACAGMSYVPCFSNQIHVQRNQGGIVEDCFNNHLPMVPANPSETFARIDNHQLPSSLYSTTQSSQFPENFSLPGSVFDVQDDSFLRDFLQNHGTNMRSLKTEEDMASISQDSTVLQTATGPMNTEIPSMVSNLEMGRRPFAQEALPISAGRVEFNPCWF